MVEIIVGLVINLVGVVARNGRNQGNIVGRYLFGARSGKGNDQQALQTSECLSLLNDVAILTRQTFCLPYAEQQV